MTQTKEEFVSGCRVGEGQAVNALNIREAIANLAGATPEAIRAEDRFDTELLQYEFWGSLDSIAVRYELEKCLAIKFTDRIVERIPDPERTKGLTVGRWVYSVIEATSSN